jgi:hypothetical protein
MAVVILPGVVGSDGVRRVAELTGLDEDAVVGKLVRLWESSQRIGKTEASVTEIGFWLRAGPNAQAWVDAFADPLAQFLEPAEAPAHFRIRGNSDHIEKASVMREANRQRAIKRWTKRLASDDNAGGIPAAYGQDTGGLSVECLNQAIPSEPKLNQTKPNQAPQRGLHRPDSPLGISIFQALEDYRQVMLHFGVQREPGMRDRIEIQNAVARYGYETVQLAFLGAKKQKASKQFDPAQFVAAATYLRHDRIDRYANLGSGKESADGLDWSKICQR